jgi:hypothetical protein
VEQNISSLVYSSPNLFGFLSPVCEIVHLALSARSATPLAEAVPGNEGDYPCTIDGPVIRNQSKGLVSGAGMVGA